MAIALLFAGQGAQKVGMGKSLFEASASVRALYKQAREILGWDLARVSFEGPDTELTLTEVCQPALFVHGMALHTLLAEQGKLGDGRYALGLSLGEITAYTAAGVFDFATGLRVVAERGRLMQLACEQSVGGMAAILGEERAKVAELCAAFDIEAANFNAPGQIIVSGEKAKVDAAVAAAKDQGIKKIIPLNVAGAYHSRLMEPARAAFAAFLDTVTFAAPRLTVFTNTTGASGSGAGGPEGGARAAGRIVGVVGRLHALGGRDGGRGGGGKFPRAGAGRSARRTGETHGSCVAGTELGRI